MSLRAPDWPRCDRCSKPSHPERRVTHEGKVYCSPSCVEALQEELAQATLRARVLKRDKGVCEECGLDCLALRAELDKLIADAKDKPSAAEWKPAAIFGWQSSLNTLEARLHQLALLGFDRNAVMSGAALWEMDHRDARVRGGSNALSNVRSLCVPDHKKVSAELARERAGSRRPRRFGR